MTDTNKSTRVSGWKAREYVQKLQLFHNSGTNHRHPKGATLWSEQRGDIYVVFSYGYHWPLYINWKGVWFRNSDKYGLTTSKHSSQANPLVQCVPLCQSLMVMLLAKERPCPEMIVMAAQLKLLPDSLIPEVTSARIAA